MTINELHSIIDFFEENAKQTPNRLAVSYKDLRITYAEFNARTDKLAGLLQARGVGRGDIVALCMDRCEYFVLSVFALFKLGAAYLPLNPTWPDNRLSSVLSDSGSRIVVTLSHHMSPSLTEANRRTLVLDGVDLDGQDLPYTRCLLAFHDLAYVIYTSGSTGQPKGVMVEHGSLMNRLNWMQKKYPLDGQDVILHKTPVTFDVSVWEILWWCLAGCELAILPSAAETNPKAILSFIREHRVSVIHFVPSVLNIFLTYLEVHCPKETLKTLRHVFASGEALRTDAVKSFIDHFTDLPAQLSNLYGPTEATIDVTYFDCTPTADINFQETHVPIGKPIDNTKVLVLDENLKPVADQAEGELYIGGINLARGYLNQPELTDEKFVTDPLQVGQRLYRTGDRARFDQNGNLIFCGRIDGQVKLRGIRIELEDIEHHGRQFSAIRDIAVAVREDIAANHYLCAYLILVDDQADWNEQELRRHLAAEVPSYMIPHKYIVMNEFPLTESGKLDRKKLPNPFTNS